MTSERFRTPLGGQKIDLRIYPQQISVQLLRRFFNDRRKKARIGSMALSIGTNNSALDAASALFLLGRNIETSMERLATGKRSTLLLMMPLALQFHRV